MTDAPTTDPGSMLSPLWWWNLWPAQTASPPLPAFAPHTLTQPIQPGWNFGAIITVNERNSSAPETEREIVAEESYGRQLGRILDAVSVLIEERSAKGPPPKALAQLLELRRTIEKIKSDSVAARLARLEADLLRLKNERPDDYRRMISRIVDDSDSAAGASRRARGR